MPRCSAHSPTDQTDGALVRSASSTTMPRLTSMPGGAGERGLGAHAGGDDDARRGQLLAVVEHDAVGLDPRGAAPQPADDALRLQRALQDPRGAGVELLAHELAGELDDRDHDAVGAQPGGGLEAEQPAADDDRAGTGRRGGERVGVAPGAKDVDMREVDARHRRNERPRAGREHERVVGMGDAGVVDDGARVEVERVGAAAAAQVDLVVGVPRQRAQLELAGPARAREQLGEQHAVVGRPGLLAEHDDLPVLRLAAAQRLLDDGEAGHPGADDDEPLRRGGRAPPDRVDALAHPLQPDGDGLQLGLLGGRVDGAERQRVQRARAGDGVHRAPVKGDERDAARHALVERDRHAQLAAARDDAAPGRPRRRPRRRRRAGGRRSSPRRPRRAASASGRCASSCATGRRRGRSSAAAGTRDRASRRAPRAASARSARGRRASGSGGSRTGARCPRARRRPAAGPATARRPRGAGARARRRSCRTAGRRCRRRTRRTPRRCCATRTPRRGRGGGRARRRSPSPAWPRPAAPRPAGRGRSGARSSSSRPPSPARRRRAGRHGRARTSRSGGAGPARRRARRARARRGRAGRRAARRAGWWP